MEQASRIPTANPLSLKLKKGLARTIVTALGVIIALIVIFTSLAEYVQPYEWGVREVRIGKKGVRPDKLGAGLYLDVKNIYFIHRLPRILQSFEMTNFKGTSASHPDQKAALIQTSDGYSVNMDCSILYRIVDPAKVIKDLGPGKAYIYRGLIPKVEPVLKQSFGELRAEELYDVALRTKKAELTRVRLNKILSDKGIKVENVLVRYLQYDSVYQGIIEDKKIEDQEAELEKALDALAVENKKLKQVEETGIKDAEVIVKQGEAYRRTKTAELSAYIQKKKAEGNNLVRGARADTRKMEVLARKGAGTEKVIGLEMAKALEGLEVIILPSDGKSGMNPLNLDKFMSTLGIREER